MRIPDKDIPMADPAEVIQQYSAWVQKIANKYTGIVEDSGVFDMEDLHQSGCMALLEAQKTFDPDRGKTFMSWSYLTIKNAMLTLLGYRDKARHIPPAPPIPLDKPISDDSDDRLLDTIEDPDYIPVDEQICDKETREETRVEVRAAVDRLKSPAQREVIRRLYLDGQDREKIANDMRIEPKKVSSLDREARRKLRRDKRLCEYAMPFFNVSINRFRTTWTSAVEAAVIWREQHQSQLMELAGGQDPDDVQTSI